MDHKSLLHEQVSFDKLAILFNLLLNFEDVDKIISGIIILLSE